VKEKYFHHQGSTHRRFEPRTACCLITPRKRMEKPCYHLPGPFFFPVLLLSAKFRSLTSYFSTTWLAGNLHPVKRSPKTRALGLRPGFTVELWFPPTDPNSGVPKGRPSNGILDRNPLRGAFMAKPPCLSKRPPPTTGLVTSDVSRVRRIFTVRINSTQFHPRTSRLRLLSG